MLQERDLVEFLPLMEKIIRTKARKYTDVEDLTQTAALRIWEYRASYDPTRCSPHTWMTHVMLSAMARFYNPPAKWQRGDQVELTEDHHPVECASKIEWHCMLSELAEQPGGAWLIQNELNETQTNRDRAKASKLRRKMQAFAP